MLLKFSLPLLSMLFASLASAQTVRQVPGEWPNIQSAIDASRNGDTVVVDAGTYFERIDFRGRDILVRSVRGPGLTVIDGAGAGPVVQFRSGESRAAMLDGFTITHGQHALYAGGVHIADASPTLSNNRIVENLGGRHGHGISILRSTNALIVSNQISGNRSAPMASGAGGGGGIGVGGAGRVEIRANRISANRVTRLSSGGGIFLNYAGATQVIGNLIDDNSTRLEGAGIAIFGSSEARIENNQISGNRVIEPGKGGGVSWLLLPGSQAPAVINNTLAHNYAEQGSGIYADGDDSRAQIVNNLLLAAPGQSAIECGEFYDPMPPRVRHNNAVSDSEAYAGSCSDALGSHGNLSITERFGAQNYRLVAGSSSIDAGENIAAIERVDLAGQARIRDGNDDHDARIDIGAFEFGAPLTAPGLQ